RRREARLQREIVLPSRQHRRYPLADHPPGLDHASPALRRAEGRGRCRARCGAALGRHRGQGRHHCRPRAGAGGRMSDAPTAVSLATATPGGGFPFFGDNAAAAINETDPSLKVTTQNTKGSTENIGLLNERKIDIALVAGEPAYEAFQGIDQPKTT